LFVVDNLNIILYYIIMNMVDNKALSPAEIAATLAPLVPMAMGIIGFGLSLMNTEFTMVAKAGVGMWSMLAISGLGTLVVDKVATTLVPTVTSIRD